MKALNLKSYFLILCLLLCSTGCIPALEQRLNEVKEEEIVKIVSKSAEWQSIQRTCENIPRVSNTRLVRRDLSTHEPKQMYYYFFAEGGIQNTKNLFNSYFRDEWDMVSSHYSDAYSFKNKKEGIGVHIQYGGMGSGITYSITCEKPR